jgi:hypothetical protein
MKFDLPSPEALHHMPAVACRKISNFRFGHSSKDCQLCRLSDEILRLIRKYRRDFCLEGWQMLVHKACRSIGP